MSEKISSFKDLRVYKLAFEVQQEIFETSKRFPPEERYALTDQIRRASRSIGANLAEAWQKRRYVAHFVSKLTDADGEQAETQHWLDTAIACNYFSKKRTRGLASEMLQDRPNAGDNDGETLKSSVSREVSLLSSVIGPRSSDLIERCAAFAASLTSFATNRSKRTRFVR